MPAKINIVGNVYYNSKGLEYIVLEEYPRAHYTKSGVPLSKFKIRFTESGYETIALKESVMGGNIKDKLSPSLYGVGCIGYCDTTNPTIYLYWHAMISRCYNTNDIGYHNYGGKGITVCDRWKRYDLFAEDFVKLPGYQDMINNPDKKYVLDKDSLQQNIPSNQKIYSPETCMIISEYANAARAIIDKKDRSRSKYYGVSITRVGNYAVEVKANGNRYFIGTYDTEEAAAAAYNYYASRYRDDNNLMLNDVPEMSLAELSSHMVSKRNMVKDITKTFAGVTKKKGKTNYESVLYLDGRTGISLGMFSNPVAAANCHNYFAMLYGMPEKVGPAPYMDRYEWGKYMTRKKVMCHIVDK